MNNLFEYNEISFDTTYIQYVDCTMLKDFSSIKKGDKFACIAFDFEEATLRFYETVEDLEPEHTVAITVIPANE